MNNYITGKVIKELRIRKNMTQQDLADKLNVSVKTISKWETNRGLPDISLIESLADSLNVSIIELMSGNYKINTNKTSNMLKSNIYVCPICGNVITSIGDSVVSCCGVTLPVLESDQDDQLINCEKIENEYYVSINHPMTKEHYISFIAYITTDRVELVKLYPEGNPEARFLVRGHGLIYCYCNKHGLYKTRV